MSCTARTRRLLVRDGQAGGWSSETTAKETDPALTDYEQ